MAGRDARVLVLISSTDRRGAEIEGQTLSIELTGLGFETSVIALAHGQDDVQVEVSTLGESPLAVATLRSLRRLAADFDVIIAYGSSTLPACAIALLGTKIPFIYRSIGDPVAWARGRMHRLRTSLQLRRAAVVVALWPGAETAKKQLYRVPDQKLRSIPNARSKFEFRPPTKVERSAARRQLDLTDDGLVVAVVGSLSPEKRVDLALDALASVPGARLLVAGDGPEHSRLRTAVRANADLSDRTQFLGAIDDVLPVLHASDLLLSTSRTEGMPGVLIEAGMCGLPVVATDVGAVMAARRAHRGRRGGRRRRIPQ